MDESKSEHNNRANSRSRNKATPYLPSYMTPGQPCSVCGDDATGMHYRAITCEGCKGFFRRTVQRHMVYKCKNDGECEVGKASRNGCQACRYQKCIKCGMARSLVLNEQERKDKRDLINKNRERRELERMRLLYKAGLSADKQEQMKPRIDQVTKNYCKILDNPLEYKFKSTTNSKRLSALITLVSQRVREFAKTIEVFDELTPPEQEHLIASSWLIVRILRAIHEFDLDKGCLMLANETIYLRSDAHSKDTAEIFEELMDLAEGFAGLQMDYRQLALLSALLIYNPENLNFMPSVSPSYNQ